MSELSQKNKKVFVTLPDNARASLERLAALKFFGETPSEVARYLIVNGLDALIEKRRLKDPLKSED